jgi:dipeptidyl aminopeptidase/acylaminoacyl peptidase
MLTFVLRHRSAVIAPALTLLLLGSLMAAAAGHAAPAPARLTLEQIMARDWIGTPPESPYWADDGSAVYYERRRPGTELKDLYRVALSGGEPTLVPLAQRGAVDAPDGDISHDRKWKAYSREGDLFLKNLETGAVRQITRTADEETEPHFLADDRRVAFRRGKTIFLYELASGLISQPAELRLEKDPKTEDAETAADYLKAQQLRLFDIIRERKEKRDAARAEDSAERQADPTRPPLPWYLGDKVTIAQTALSPSGDWMLVATLPKDADTGKKALMADFVTASGNVESKEVRPKVGAPKPVTPTLLLLDLRNHKKHKIDLSPLPGLQDDPLKELRAKAEKAKKELKRKDEEDGEKKDKDEEEKEDEKKRPVELASYRWSDDGSRLALQLRAYDNKDRWLATVAPSDHPVLVNRHRLTDPAWINWDLNEMGWLKDNATLWYLSEESGTSHLYLQSTDGGTGGPGGPPRQMTRGKFEVSNPALSRDGRFIYYTANADHPGHYNTFRVELASGKIEQLSRLGGLTTFLLSPDETRLLLANSQLARPNELFAQDIVQANRAQAEARQITHTVSAAFQSQPWVVPAIVPVPSSHQKDPIYSRVYTPAGKAEGKLPAVVFVHGAGYLQDAHAGWSSYFHEFMFHTYLVRHGYVVLDMDYRGSAGYGRAWRTAIYRQMGHPELEDLQDGVAWLVKTKNVDPRRVGVYGGSYGGFMVYMALFRAPDLFAAGAALRPVADWAHYNHDYTADILNTPEIDPEAYAASSPIEYAAGLTRPLLICDGMQDDNVFFQDNVRMVQRLIELKKQSFELAVYPVEAHGFQQPSSWLDEYRRIFKLMETYVREGKKPLMVD